MDGVAPDRKDGTRWAALERRLADEVTRLAPTAPRLVVALSGGGDSVAALHLLQRAGYDLVAAHFEHGLREGSKDDARFVEELCERLGVPLEQSGADVARIARSKGWNVEDAARRLRYSFLYKVLTTRAPGGAIVVAHTLEDQAETVLLQLFRGAAYPVGMDRRQRGLIRPLLGERRQALRDYLTYLGEEWREDATNATVEQNRAWLRNQLIPQLEGRYPAVQKSLSNTAAAQQEAKLALEQLARRRFPPGAIRLRSWSGAPAALRKTALAERLREAGSTPSHKLLEEVNRATERYDEEGSAAPPWRASLPGGGEVVVAYGELTVTPEVTRHAPASPEEVRVASQLPQEVDPGVLERHPNLELRPRRSGDRIRLAAGSKLLSDLLIDLKVPVERRGELRVLASGSEVLWVEGVAVAHGAAAEGVPPVLDDDRRFMRAALEQARKAREMGEVPIGAVVVSAQGELLAAAHNLTETNSDATAHAELLALQAAGRAAGDWRLGGATLYVTLEPCPMCLGAVLQTQLGRVVYGADNHRDGALGGVTDLLAEGWKRVPAVTGGVEATASERLLRSAFEAGRGQGRGDGAGEPPA